jgi:hypothetical protein
MPAGVNYVPRSGTMNLANDYYPHYFLPFVCSLRLLKVHKHEIFLYFLLPKSNPYMP